jgi:hypothetical protein
MSDNKERKPRKKKPQKPVPPSLKDFPGLEENLRRALWAIRSGRN